MAQKNRMLRLVKRYNSDEQLQIKQALRQPLPAAQPMHIGSPILETLADPKAVASIAGHSHGFFLGPTLGMKFGPLGALAGAAIGATIGWLAYNKQVVHNGATLQTLRYFSTSPQNLTLHDVRRARQVIDKTPPEDIFESSTSPRA
jgi:hypothetical protein